MVTDSGKVIPVPDAVSRPFWAAANRGELHLQYCVACRSFQFYPRPICKNCGSAHLKWRASSGQGIVYSFTIVHRAPREAYVSDVPYVVALVDTEEGVRMLTNIVGCTPESVRIGMPVVVTFEALTEDIALPKFSPAETPD